MQFFVDTAKVGTQLGLVIHDCNNLCVQECEAIRSYSSLCAIMDALRSKDIARLVLTQNKMSFAARRKHQRLIKFPDRDSNYDVYRKVWLKDWRTGCISWHGAHPLFAKLRVRLTTPPLTVVDLHDIGCIIQEQMDVDEHHEPPLIRVEKWTQLRHRATAYRHFVPSEYERQNIGRAVEYLRAGLQSITPGEDFSRALQAMSRALKRQEDQITVQLTGF